MRVEVAYALPERQWLIAVEVEAGATVADALRASGLLQQRSELVGRSLTLAIHGCVVGQERSLRAGDRIEVLRPLLADPKDVRRRLAAEGKAMGRRRSG